MRATRPVATVRLVPDFLPGDGMRGRLGILLASTPMLSCALAARVVNVADLNTLPLYREWIDWTNLRDA